MITRIVYNNKAFKLIDNYGFKSSNNEVTFNDIKIDFTDCTFADIPYKYQEVKIIQAETEENILNGDVLFTGYLDDIDLSEMKNQKESREMTLTLLSPLKMATVRTVSLIGTYKVEEAIKRVLQPLIDDGFIIKEINIADGQITTNFLLETIENCMNNVCSKRNIFWYINEKKEIFVNSIDYLFGLSTVKTINQDIKENGLIKIQPTIKNIDYANVINFKNVRLIYSQENSSYTEDYTKPNGYPIMTTEKYIKNGDIIDFDNPIIVDESYLRDYQNNLNDDPFFIYSFGLQLELSNGDTKSYSIGIRLEKDNVNYNKYIKNGSITFSDNNGDEGEIVLQRDNFFKNLITGFKWNYNSNAKIKTIQSDTALRYTTMRFMYSAEINKLKGVISNSGQIEKTIDYSEKWTTLSQLISYARSLMVQNSNVVNQVELEYDVNPNLEIGDIIEIKYPDFYIEGRFAVKDISYIFKNENEQEWKITLKSSDLISTYIDLFRPIEQEQNESVVNTLILSEFVEEQMNEIHIVKEVLNEN